MTWHLKPDIIKGLLCSDCEQMEARFVLIWHPPGMELDHNDPPKKVPHVFPLCVHCAEKLPALDKRTEMSPRLRKALGDSIEENRGAYEELSRK